jgi:dimethylaniline monooxygenase (N-oxide forming)
VPYPPRDKMNAGIAACRSKRGESQLQAMHLMALLFAREANVEPDLREWPQLAPALLFGPLSTISFRLSGPDRLLDAGERIATEARALGTVGTAGFSSEQVAQLQARAKARKDSEFAEFVDRITKPVDIVSH